MTFLRWSSFALVALVLHAAAASVSSADPKGGTFTDPRDQQAYATVELGGMTWMARNLAYASPGSFCYENDPENCKRWGRMYRWEPSLAVCPEGWHLSTDHEWMALELAQGMPFAELEYTRARGDVAALGPDVGGRLLIGGDSGFEGEAGGWRHDTGEFDEGGEAGAWWTATDADLDHAWHRDLRPGRRGVWRSRVVKPYALSVRCVKDRLSEDVPKDEAEN